MLSDCDPQVIVHHSMVLATQLTGAPVVLQEGGHVSLIRQPETEAFKWRDPLVDVQEGRLVWVQHSIPQQHLESLPVQIPVIYPSDFEPTWELWGGLPTVPSIAASRPVSAASTQISESMLGSAPGMLKAKILQIVMSGENCLL